MEVCCFDHFKASKVSICQSYLEKRWLAVMKMRKEMRRYFNFFFT